MTVLIAWRRCVVPAGRDSLLYSPGCRYSPTGLDPGYRQL